MASEGGRSAIFNQLQSSGLATAAVVAATAVNAAVSMRPLSAPDDSVKSYVKRDEASEGRIGMVDEVGLPYIYDRVLIEKYWSKQGSAALNSRWSEFLGYAVPFLTKIVTLLVRGGSDELRKNSKELSRSARLIMEKLGPTYVKLGQLLSVRPDILPSDALEELQLLQDSVKPFDTQVAIDQIEKELGGELSCFFTEISSDPVAAASLAQVYKARLKTGEYVAVKIQRPKVLETVSKDLYVLRRAAEVYQGLVDRFAPQQKTNYVALLNEWAIGFYTELDFLNEAANQIKLKNLLNDQNVTGVYIPEVYTNYTTRRIMVSEWIDGKKLSSCSPDIIRSVTGDAQEAFLTQLLSIGLLHGDPHGGNMIYMDNPRGVGNTTKLALIDFGLVAGIKQDDIDSMIGAIIHLANRDYSSLVDDFINLKILPNDCNRALIIPLMDKALTPYVKGGGAARYEEELKKMYGMDGTLSGTSGGFSRMTSDAITVLKDIPFSIPPYFALLGRAIVTLEGIALTGNPNYGIILEAYPFVARKLLKDDRPSMQKTLQEVLYAQSNGLKTTRLSVLLNSALGVVARQSGGAFVDFDSIPEDSISLATALKFIFSEKASSLRNILIDEAVSASDILLRQATRKGFNQVVNRIPKIFPSSFPSLDDVPVPFLLPTNPSSSSSSYSLSVASFKPVFLTPRRLIEVMSPKLTREEELFAVSLTDLTRQIFGEDASIIVNGDALLDQTASARFLLGFVNSAVDSSLFPPQASDVMKQIRPLIPSSLGNHNSDGLRDLSAGLHSLTPYERDEAKRVVNIIFDKLREKVVNRLQTLL